MPVPAPDDLSARLRALPVFAGALPPFDPDAAPRDPAVLFGEWLQAAIDAGVREPHAMSLATADGDGLPNVRVLILKAVTPDARWRFAGSRASAKGAELGACAAAAAALYWPALGRQVRVRGAVRETGAEASAADFAARSPAARAEASAADWTLWEIVADQVEFFQGDAGRRHGRLCLARTPSGWTRTEI